jgi:peptidyl-prolyl cis-trans isomerase SurA
MSVNTARQAISDTEVGHEGMEAATPLRRLFITAGFLALVGPGCKSAPAADNPPSQPVLRSQVPSDVIPSVAPLPSTTAPVVGSPIATAANSSNPVVGSPVDHLVNQAVDSKPIQPIQLTGGYQPGGAGIAAVARSAMPSGKPQVRVVAIVGASNTGGSIITDQEVREIVKQRQSEFISESGLRDDAKEKEVWRDSLRKLIDRELILDEMVRLLTKKGGKSNGLDDLKNYASKQADEQLRSFRRAAKLQTEEEFRVELARAGFTLSVLRRNIERELMAQEYIKEMTKDKGKVSAGFAEVRAYYDTHPDEFMTEDRVRWMGVFVPFSRFQPGTRQSYDYAAEIARQAASGADFLGLVKAADPVPGRQNWDGIGTKRGKILPVEVEPTIWSLKPRQVSGLIETPAGYHIVKVLERDYSGLKPFDDKTQALIRNKLRGQTLQREREVVVDKLWRRGVVRILSDEP